MHSLLDNLCLFVLLMWLSKYSWYVLSLSFAIVFECFGWCSDNCYESFVWRKWIFPLEGFQDSFKLRVHGLALFYNHLSQDLVAEVCLDTASPTILKRLLGFGVHVLQPS